MSDTHDVHERFGRRLADHLLDLLDADESARLEAHARTCESCGRQLAAARAAKADWWEGAGHPPVTALVAHAERPESLDELTRTFVTRHLESCAECREDALTLAGAPAPAAAEAAPAVTAPAPSRVPAYGPWALAGSFAALLLVFVFMRSPRAPEPVAAIQPEVRQPSAPESQPAPSGAPSSAPAPVAAALPPVVIEGAERGVANEPTRVEVPAGAGEIAFTLPALFVPEGATLVIELHDGAGSVLSRDELPAARALSPGGVTLPAARLLSGARVLRVAWFDDSSGSEAREYPLLIVRH